MILYIESDASYGSETESRSRGGGYFYLGNKIARDSEGKISIDPKFNNGPIECISSILKSVLSSAAESEYGTAFMNAQSGVGFRNTLLDMGWAQPATPLAVDNQCAVGLANRTIKQRRSRAITMRYHWIRDRVQRGEFEVYWRPGKTNRADYFTKVHPIYHYKEMRNTFVRTPPLAVIQKTNPAAGSGAPVDSKLTGSFKGCVGGTTDTEQTYQ